MRLYEVSQADVHDKKSWYAHMPGFPYVPVMGCDMDRPTFGTKNNALHIAAMKSNLRYEEFMRIRGGKNNGKN